MNSAQSGVLSSVNWCFALFLVFLLGSLFGTCGSAAEQWQTVNISPYAQTDIPPGFQLVDGNKNQTDLNSTSFSATSPDRKTKISYILNHTANTSSLSDLRDFQSRKMSSLGFRICKTKDPVIIENGSDLSIRQVYVRGTEDGAVIYSAAKPGWGQYHYILQMTGADAVARYYESIPEEMKDHIRLSS